MNGLRAMLFAALRSLRASMTAQISLSITLVSVLLVAGSCYLVVRMTTDELREGGELIMLANLAILRDDLDEAQFDLERTSRTLVDRIELQLGSLHVALLDPQRRVIAASEGFEVPLDRLPVRAFAVSELPTGITQGKLRTLQKRTGPLTQPWTSADGRLFRILLAEIPPPEGVTGVRTGPVLAALALEITQSRELVQWGGKVVLLTLVSSALAAGLLGLLIARRIVVVARRLGHAAGRISANALGERLSLVDTPSELVESALAFNRMLDRLQAAFNRLSQFSSDLAHDLRTPINNLLGEAQVALSRPRGADEYRQVLESAVEDYERISRLIENMLFLARAEDPRASLEREWIDLSMASVRLHDYFEPLAEERGVGIQCGLRGSEDGPRRVWADKTLLLRALSNLISNALRYAPAGSTVSVLATPREDGACLIEVSNLGPAIAAGEQQRIFERLFRIDPAREGSASGSGLGLAIVKSIMEMHGGRASVRSAEGEPTTFGLWFPPPPPVPMAT
jgi:two-component system heavy metal sensor histidine kinase CusS